MKYHFIAIGGSVMHNLAVAMKQKGHKVTGSDDVVYEPAKSVLKYHNLLPEKMGWFEERISPNLDFVVLGMHAKQDNPELLKAQKLGIPVVSFPEFLYQQSINKQRIVVAGSHGKTTTTSILMHVLKKQSFQFDYMVGSKIEGFDTMVGFSDDNQWAIFEGDEYLSSPLDKRPKFHWYKPNMAILTGIAWDHINVFPTLDNYIHQFKVFIEEVLQENAVLIYNGLDPIVKKLVRESKRKDIVFVDYSLPAYSPHLSGSNIVFENKTYWIPLMGQHNMQNMEASRILCRQLGIDSKDFFNALSSYKGSSKRLEKVIESKKIMVYRDFAHSPSKVSATVKAFSQQFKNHYCIALFELHTFSSLNKAFLKEYAGSLNGADKAIVFLDPKVKEKKGNLVFSQAELKLFFDRKDLCFTESVDEIENALADPVNKPRAVLLMSSGDFGGWNFSDWAKTNA